MNERIQELAKEAGLKVNADGEISQAWYGSVDAGYRKFAELIIRECGKTLVDNTPVVDLTEDWDRGYDRAMNDCIHLIYEHFGVE